jgi:tetratricopeptide (TPR) repeat protein
MKKLVFGLMVVMLVLAENAFALDNTSKQGKAKIKKQTQQEIKQQESNKKEPNQVEELKVIDLDELAKKSRFWSDDFKDLTYVMPPNITFKLDDAQLEFKLSEIAKKMQNKKYGKLASSVNLSGLFSRYVIYKKGFRGNPMELTSDVVRWVNHGINNLSGDYISTIEEFERDVLNGNIISITPYDFQELERLDTKIRDKKLSVSERLQFLHKIIEIRPDDFMALYLLGDHYFALGETEKAMQYLMDAWALAIKHRDIVESQIRNAKDAIKSMIDDFFVMHNVGKNVQMRQDDSVEINGIIIKGRLLQKS